MASALKNLSKYDESTIPSAEELSFGIVLSEWNTEITHALYEGCYDTLIKHGAKPDNIHTVQAPGAFELPSAAKMVGSYHNPDAVKVAQAAVSSEGLEDRILVLEGDMSNLEARPEFSDVDVIFCFFCGHDLWPRKNCLQAMQNLRTAFPSVKRFLLCDTYRSDIVPSLEIPMFTLGFEFMHSVMGQFRSLTSESCYK